MGNKNSRGFWINILAIGGVVVISGMWDLFVAYQPWSLIVILIWLLAIFILWLLEPDTRSALKRAEGKEIVTTNNSIEFVIGIIFLIMLMVGWSQASMLGRSFGLLLTGSMFVLAFLKK